MNFPEAIRNASHHWRPFYRNSYMCKPAVLLKMISYMTTAMDIAENNSAVKALLSQDSGHDSFKRQEILPATQQAFGKDSYEYLPFILERLPIFFSNYLNCSMLFFDQPFEAMDMSLEVGKRVETLWSFSWLRGTVIGLSKDHPDWAYSILYDDGRIAEVNAKLVRQEATSESFPIESSNSRRDSAGRGILLYIIYHDDASKILAIKGHQLFPHMTTPVFINSTKFFESIAYRDILPSRVHEWQNKSYVGTISYKVITSDYVFQFRALIEKIASLVSAPSTYDFIPFVYDAMPGSFLLMDQVRTSILLVRP